VSCYIIGPEDNPPVHAIGEALHADDEKDEVKLFE